MSAAPVQRLYTPEEYLALEREAEFKSEYIDGYIVPVQGPLAMAGTSREHNIIAGNLFSELRTQMKGRPCQAYFADMRVGVDSSGRYVYPDIAAVCGEPEFVDDRLDTLLNPSVIVEVLSPTTEKMDRGEKSERYRQMESLQEYVLVAQDRVHVERYVRRGEEWVLTDLNDLDDTLRLASVGCDVPLREIYDKVEFPPRPSPASD